MKILSVGFSFCFIQSICENVIGLDVSPSQIENAVKKENIEYRCQAAEDLTFLESNSVDLVTIAAALHWLDRDAFFAEVHRVLKDKTGVLAVWTYDLGFLNNPQANEIYQQFFNEFLRDFWDRKGVVAIDCYESIADTFPYQSSLEVNIFKNERTTTIENLLGFIESISAVQTYRKKQGDIEYQRVINELRENLFAFYKDWNDSEGNRKPIILTIPVKQYLMRKNHGQ